MQVVGTRQTLFQSTRLSRASTPQKSILFFNTAISIHKALASLDSKSNTNVAMMGISIHKALASLDSFRTRCRNSLYDFNPQGSREPRRFMIFDNFYNFTISIHKALASLDGKNAQLFLHLCHIYMLHIIHLLQIVYQVEISSRNLIVFSGQL